MKTGIKNFVKFFAFFLIVAGILFYLNKVFFYYDKSVWSTDHRVEQYQELPENSLDVLFLGSSNVMSSVNPLQLWKETGIQSYAYCSRAQTFAFAYGYLQDALKTQNPEYVVIDAYSIFSDKVINGLANTDFHFGINMDNLSVQAKTELLMNHVSKSEWLAYYFPLFKNHNYFKNWPVQEDETEGIFMGYCYADGVEWFDVPQPSEGVGALEAVDELYMKKIMELCEEKGIKLFVIKTPIFYSVEEHQELNALKQMCENNGVMFYDMSLDINEWGFDYTEDMIDYFHNNSSGAEKVTARLGEVFVKIDDFSNSETHKYADIWAAEYERMTAHRSQMLEQTE